MNSSRQAHIVDSKKGRTASLVGDVYRLLVSGVETQGRYAVVETLVPPGGGPPPHLHRREEEGFFVLEGEITFLIGERRLVAGPGTFANMPIGVPHAFKNESIQPARMIVLVAPAGFEQMFFEVGTELPPGSTAPVPPSAEEIERLKLAAARYGIEFIPPKS